MIDSTSHYRGEAGRPVDSNRAQLSTRGHYRQGLGRAPVGPGLARNYSTLLYSICPFLSAEQREIRTGTSRSCRLAFDTHQSPSPEAKGNALLFLLSAGNLSNIQITYVES